MTQSFFENEYYIDTVPKCIRRTASYFSEYAYTILSGDIALFKRVMKAMITGNRSRNGSYHHPILPIEALFVCGVSEEEKKELDNQLKALKNWEEIDRKKKEWLEKQIADYSDEQVLDCFHKMLTLHTDEAASFKLFSLAKVIDYRIDGGGYAERINAFADKGWDDYAKQCVDLRNSDIGHRTQNTIIELSIPVYQKALGTLVEASQRLCDIPGEDNLRKQKNETIEFIKEKIEESKIAPLTNAQLQELFAEYDYSEEYLLPDFKNEYDSKEKVLYWHTVEEVGDIVKEKHLIKNTEKLLRAAEERNAVAESKLDSIRAILAGDGETVSGTQQPAGPVSRPATRRERVTRVFPAMSEYAKKRGHLTEEQIRELAKNATVLAAADFWLREDGCKFLKYEMAKILSSNNRRLLIDWNTRVELYKIETNIGNNCSKEETQLAKDAHNAMHMMARRQFVSYLPQNNYLCTSEQGIIMLAKKHPESIFCVFTNSRTFVEAAIAEEVNNIIPVCLLPTGALMVRPTAAPLLEACFLADDPTGDIQETQETQELQVTQEPQTIRQPAQQTIKRDNALKVDNGKLIEIDTVSDAGDIVFDSSGNPVRLLKEIGSGGEGKIYLSDKGNLVAKIYKKEKLTEMRRDKLEAMVSASLKIDRLCLPTELLYTKEGVFIGYLMRNADGYIELGCSVLKIKMDDIAKELMPGWDRLALVELCIGLCRTFKEMQAQNLLMGDINPCNIMVNLKSKSHSNFVFVDCDSYQFDGYPCPVGTMIYTSPKIYERNNAGADRLDFGTVLREKEDENYAIASLLFHILMLGDSPFAGKGDTNIEQAIRNYNFAYRIAGDDESTGADTPDGDARLIWNNMAPGVRNLFGRVFKRAENVSVDEWIEALQTYKSDIDKGIFTKELKPKNYWDNKKQEYTVFFTCAACGQTRNTPRERYEREERFKNPHLCAQCTQVMHSLKKKRTPENSMLRCSKCGKEYPDTQWNAWLVLKGYKKAICPMCNETITARCDCCGRDIRQQRWRITETRRKGGLYCNHCWEKIDVVCDRCGRSFQEVKWKYQQIKRAGRGALCKGCREEVSSRRR